MELADTPDLGSGAFGHGGSSPPLRSCYRFGTEPGSARIPFNPSVLQLERFGILHCLYDQAALIDQINTWNTLNAERNGSFILLRIP